MTAAQNNLIKSVLPIAIGVILTITQGFVVYYSKNVDMRLAQMDQKLDRTWEMTLKTTTEVATLKERLTSTNAELITVKQDTAKTREELAALKGMFTEF